MRGLFSLLLLLASSSSFNGAVSAAPASDFFLLVLQYAPALCTDGTFHCPTKANWTYFTLHGLWPEKADGTYPSSCTNEKFDPTVIKGILPQLNKCVFLDGAMDVARCRAAARWAQSAKPATLLTQCLALRPPPSTPNHPRPRAPAATGTGCRSTAPPNRFGRTSMRSTAPARRTCSPPSSAL